MEVLTKGQAEDFLKREVFNLRKSFPRWDWTSKLDFVNYRPVSGKGECRATFEVTGVQNGLGFHLRGELELDQGEEEATWEVHSREIWNPDEDYFDSAVEAMESVFDFYEGAVETWEILKKTR